jgi:hypothetical protein
MCSHLINARLRLESKRPEIREMVLGDRALLPDSVPAMISADVRRAIFGDPDAACLKVGDFQCEAITAVLGYLHPKVVEERKGGPPRPSNDSLQGSQLWSRRPRQSTS